MKFAFPFIVFIVAAVALFVPSTFIWSVPLIVPLLGMAMLGMGVTLSPEDFKVVIKAPKIVWIGLAAQYIIMAGLAYVIVHILNLPPEIAIGVVLVGTCPGGTASNLMTFIAKGDLALSVSMTACSTILAPILTPMLTLVLAGAWFEVNYIGMFYSIVKIVILPVVIGMILHKVLKNSATVIEKVAPVISMLAIIVIIGAVVAINAQRIFAIAGITIIAVVVHNGLGLLIGYYIGKFFKFEHKQCKTLSIEVGLQNSGLATALAKTHFVATPEAMLPAAFFSVWHNISGAVIASYWNYKYSKENHEK